MFPPYQVDHEGPGHADQRGHRGGHRQARAAQTRREYLKWREGLKFRGNFHRTMSAFTLKISTLVCKDIH